MRHHVGAMVVLGTLAGSAQAATLTVNTLGDAAGSCPGSCTLRAAIAAANAGDSIVFDAALPLPASIQLAGSQLVISNGIDIVGPGAALLSVSAAGGARVLRVASGNVLVSGLDLRNGTAAGTNGSFAGTGGSGGPGGIAEGGCVLVEPGAALILQAVALRDCEARAGAGGMAGNGTDAALGGDGGNGGSGGSAAGGAVAVRGELVLLESGISGARALGGAGGRGGDGGTGTFGGGGDGGDGGAAGNARGGAIHLAGGARLLLRNTAIVDSEARAGAGGRGGNGGSGSSVGNGGNGGAGGTSSGGSLYIATTTAPVDVEFTSLGPALVIGGIGGQAGAGSPDGLHGMSGAASGEAIAALSAPRVRGTVLLGASVADACAGSIDFEGQNIASDATCPATLTGVSFAGAFSLADTGVGVPSLEPLPGSAAIDAATDCVDLAGLAMPDDLRGTARPVDGNEDGAAVCDIGALEFRIGLFADGFE